MSPEGLGRSEVHSVGKGSEELTVTEVSEWVRDECGGVRAMVEKAADAALQVLLALDSRIAAFGRKYPSEILSNCFEVLQAEVMFDRHLRPFILKVKSRQFRPFPWRASVHLTSSLLEPLFCEALNIVGIPVSGIATDASPRGSSFEERAIGRLEEETLRMKKGKVTLWDRAFPCAKGERLRVKDADSATAYLCSYVKARGGAVGG